MNLLTIHCEDPWFSFIEEGCKPVEGRKAQDKYKNLKPGDLVTFCCVGSERSFKAEVIKVDVFSDLNAYLKEVKLENALPGVTSFEKGREIYLQWSTEEEIKQLGFAGIWIKVVK